MKEKIFINARILDPSQKIDEVGSLILNEKGKVKAIGKNIKQSDASKDALIMHPGPMNRGVEIDTKLADDINVSLVKEQVELGVAVRMACLKR